MLCTKCLLVAWRLCDALSEPSEPAAADHTGLLLSAQYWLISPLTLGLWGPVTPTIVWLGPNLMRTQAPNKALSLSQTRLPPRPQPAAPAACLGWNEVGQTSTTHRSSTLTPPLRQPPAGPPHTIWKGREWQAVYRQSRNSVHPPAPVQTQMCEVYWWNAASQH